jgi:hypothetical protein
VFVILLIVEGLGSFRSQKEKGSGNWYNPASDSLEKGSDWNGFI